MEDFNMLAADCVVISCCCQCLILQIIIFILLKLPRKLVQKTKEYAKKKLWQRKKEEKTIKSVKGRFQDDQFVEFDEESLRIHVEEFHEGHGCENCMEEVERALEEFSNKGKFAFGSFWGREGSGSSSTCVTKQEFDPSVAQFELVEIVGSFRYSY